MPRMSKRRKEEWVFFLNDRGRITYNALCRKCVYNCKRRRKQIPVRITGGRTPAAVLGSIKMFFFWTMS